MYHAYIEQAQYRMVLDEVGHDAPMALQAVKLLRVEKAKGCCRVHYVSGGRVLSHLGSAYDRASALAVRMNVAQEQMLERYDENHRKALEHEKAAKALAMEVVALLTE